MVAPLAGCKTSAMNLKESDPVADFVVAKVTVKPQITATADDIAWQTAPTIPILGLALHSPPEDRPVPTTVAMLWDGDYLYVRFTSTTSAEPVSPYGTVLLIE